VFDLRGRTIRDGQSAIASGKVRLPGLPSRHALTIWIGEAIGVEYDLRITLGEQVILASGTALCQKQNGKWRIVHMNHSNRPNGTGTGTRGALDWSRD
jgi:hypothetical protein